MCEDRDDMFFEEDEKDIEFGVKKSECINLYTVYKILKKIYPEPDLPMNNGYIKDFYQFFELLKDNNDIPIYHFIKDYNEHIFMVRYFDDFFIDKYTYTNKKSLFSELRYYNLLEEKMIDKYKNELLHELDFLKSFLNDDIEIITDIKTKTKIATEKKQKKTLEQWQDAFRYMTEIRNKILEEGKRLRKEKELWKLFEKKGYKITKTQMRFFKTLLPDGYVDRTGGAPKQ